MCWEIIIRHFFLRPLAVFSCIFLLQYVALACVVDVRADRISVCSPGVERYRSVPDGKANDFSLSNPLAS